MTHPLFYKNPVALSKSRHKLVKMRADDDFSFAAQANAIPLTGIEFGEASKEYAIVFTKTLADKIVGVAITGISNQKNLYITQDGQWNARYIPAYVRRFPFVLAKTQGEQELTVCIEDDFAETSRTKAKQLFDEQDKNTPFLENTIRFLREYHTQHETTQRLNAKLQDLDLLKEFTAEVEMKTGAKFALGGLWIVDESKWLDLPQSVIMELFKDGFLGWIYFHLTSLSNLSRLVDKMADSLDKVATTDRALADGDAIERLG